MSASSLRTRLPNLRRILIEAGKALPESRIRKSFKLLYNPIQIARLHNLTILTDCLICPATWRPSTRQNPCTKQRFRRNKKDIKKRAATLSSGS